MISVVRATMQQQLEDPMYAGAYPQFYNEEDQLQLGYLDFPIVVVYNGRDHFVPTTPARCPDVQARRREDIYRQCFMLLFTLGRELPRRENAFTQHQLEMWHQLYLSAEAGNKLH